MDLVQPSQQVWLHLLDLAGDVVVDEELGPGVARGGGQGVAAEGGAVVAGHQGLAVGLGQKSADGHAVAQPLGQGHHVGLHAVFLVAEQAAQPTHAGLHLVQDQQDALAVAPLAQSLQVVVVGDDDARLTLHRLHHHGGGAVGGCVHHTLNVVVVDVYEARQQGREVLLVVGLAGGGNGGLGAPVEGVEGGDDFVGAVTVQLAVAPGQLHGAFDGLGTAVAEEHQVEAAVLDEHLGKLQLRHGVETGWMSG